MGSSDEIYIAYAFYFKYQRVDLLIRPYLKNIHLPLNIKFYMNKRCAEKIKRGKYKFLKRNSLYFKFENNLKSTQIILYVSNTIYLRQITYTKSYR